MATALHFISGMPRSGSTLLCNILAQNPRFGVTGTSGLLEILALVRKSWEQIIELRACPDDEAKVRVLRGIMSAFHPADHEIVFDKSRGWLAYLEMAELLLERKAKVLVPVRDVRDILASFEKLYRANAALRQTPVEAVNFAGSQSVEGRCETLLRPDQPVGIAHNRIKDALARGLGDRLHFVHFTDLVCQPKVAMRGIYEFLGEPEFEHDFQNVEQVTQEDDAVHGYANLHTIRPVVSPEPSRAKELLGGFCDRIKGPWPWEMK